MDSVSGQATPVKSKDEKCRLDSVYLLPENWREPIDASPPERVLDIVTLIDAPRPSSSKPFLVADAAKNVYAFKALQNQRRLVAEAVVARVAVTLGAPVPTPRIMNLPSDLTRHSLELRGIQPGLGHGSLWVKNCSDADWIRHTHEPRNRIRLALLAALFGISVSADSQFIYSIGAPHLVWSVDHGEFLPKRGMWTTADLDMYLMAALDSDISYACRFSGADLESCHAAVCLLTAQKIAEAVAAPPKEWAFDEPEREELACILGKRRDSLLDSIERQLETR